MDVTPLFRVYARWRRAALAREDAAAAQVRVLKRLIARAVNTRFGRDHSFSKLRNIADFQKAVPLRRYENFWDEYWKDPFPNLIDVSWPGHIPLFATTSGTTSDTSKRIPISRDMISANARAALDVMVHHLAHRPHSRAFGGKSFVLGSSTELTKCAPGVFSGDLSGIALARTPAWMRYFAFPPPKISNEKDWETKIEAIAGAARQADIRVMGGTPPWLLLLFERQGIRQGKTARTLYPNLELLVHGGVNFVPYRARFEAFLDGGAELREIYPASEGFFALQDETPQGGLRVLADNGIFFEFVPVEELESTQPTRHTLANIETGVNYALILSSCAGCWAYIVGDTVRFVSSRPPRLVVTGRTSYFMSAFGEHLTGEDVEDAVAAAAQTIGSPLQDFSMGALFPECEGEKGRHLYIVEFMKGSPAADATCRFITALDERLSARNDDYAYYRKQNMLGAPEILTVQSGTFAAWMKARGRLGGQNKVPRVINDEKLFRQLRAFLAARV